MPGRDSSKDKNEGTGQGQGPGQGGRRLLDQQRGPKGGGARRPGQGHPQKEEGRREGPLELIASRQTRTVGRGVAASAFLIALIHRSAWKGSSPNFVQRGLSKSVRPRSGPAGASIGFLARGRLARG